MNIDRSYIDFIAELKQKIYSAKSKAILLANRLMIELYFEIGEEIVAKQEILGWGKSVVEQMSKDLIDEFGEKSGYSTQNLWYMRQFYLAYKDNPNLQQLVGEIPWGSNILIFSKCKDENERAYYIQNTIENSWNRNVLMHHTVKMPHENPSIGIILCTDKEKFEVEYALQNIAQPIGVSTYTIQDKLPIELNKALPTKEEIEAKMKGGFDAQYSAN